MYKFGVFLRLGMMFFMIYRVKQSFWKGFRSMKQDLESFEFRLKNWL